MTLPSSDSINDSRRSEWRIRVGLDCPPAPLRTAAPSALNLAGFPEGQVNLASPSRIRAQSLQTVSVAA